MVQTILWHNCWRGTVPHISTEWNVRTCEKETKYIIFWSAWEEGFLYFFAKLRAKSQKPWRISLSYNFAVEMGNFDMVRWKYDCVYFQWYEIHWKLILWKKADRKCKDQRRSMFLAKGALIGKSIFQIQRVNTVYNRRSSSGGLRGIPSNFTRSVRRRIVL